MQKALTQMNIQLAKVISDLSGVTGQLIVRAIIAGERDPLEIGATQSPARVEETRRGGAEEVRYQGIIASAGRVAQWLEHSAHNRLVGGSSPPAPTKLIQKYFLAEDREEAFAQSWKRSMQLCHAEPCAAFPPTET
jgi:hypothetical protein